MNELTTSELRTRIQLEMLLLESGVNSYQLVRIHHTNSNPQHKTSHHELCVAVSALLPLCPLFLPTTFRAVDRHILRAYVLLGLDATSRETISASADIAAWGGHWGMRMDAQGRVVFTDTVLCLLVDHS